MKDDRVDGEFSVVELSTFLVAWKSPSPALGRTRRLTDGRASGASLGMPEEIFE